MMLSLFWLRVSSIRVRWSDCHHSKILLFITVPSKGLYLRSFDQSKYKPTLLRSYVDGQLSIVSHHHSSYPKSRSTGPSYSSKTVSDQYTGTRSMYRSDSECRSRHYVVNSARSTRQHSDFLQVSVYLPNPGLCLTQLHRRDQYYDFVIESPSLPLTASQSICTNPHSGLTSLLLTLLLQSSYFGPVVSNGPVSCSRVQMNSLRWSGPIL